MNKLKLKVNDRVEVVYREKYYKALIIDIDNESVRINIPVNDGTYLQLDRGTKVEVYSYIADGECYNYYCSVLSKGKEGNILYYKLSKPYNIVKIQRRDFFRVKMLEKLNYKNITGLGEEAIEDKKYSEGVMLDLSAGGAKIKIKEHLKKKDTLDIILRIEGLDFKLRGEVVRAESTADNERLCGIRFVNITQIQIDKIIAKLFEITRKQKARQ